MAVTIINNSRRWAPPQYYVQNEAARHAIYAGDDIHAAVLVSILYYNPEWTRQQVASVFEREVSGGFTRAQFRDLQDSNVDFETAWRAIPGNILLSYGV